MKEVAGREVGMDCSRAVCALYIVSFWHLSEYIGINIWNSVTYQATHGVLATFTFISGYFLGKKKVESIKEIFLFYNTNNQFICDKKSQMVDYSCCRVIINSNCGIWKCRHATLVLLAIL